jgi:HK97 family phage portal protein
LADKPFVQKFWNRFIWETGQEKRSETVNLENPNVPLNGFTLSEVLGGGRSSSSGVTVTPEKSLQLSAVWRCVAIISGIISAMPVGVYAETDMGRELAKKNSTYKLWKRRPSPLYTKTVYIERSVIHLLLRGNHYAEIIQNNRGEIIRFDLLLPTQISDIKFLNGRLWYFIIGRDNPVPGERMIHVPHMGDDPICGKSTISYAREDLGMEIARRNWGAGFWNDGGSANGLLVPAQKLTSQQEAQAKASYRAAKREGGDILMPFGFDYKKMSVDPADAEFIMSGNFSIATICRWFGLPLHKLSELSRATMNNIEHQAIELLQDTVHPIISKYEDEYTTKCYTLSGDYDQDGEEDVYMEFCMDGYQRADSQAMAEAYRTGIQNGYLTPNEVREEMNRNKMEGADRLFIQQNMMPLDSVDKILVQKSQKPTQPFSKSLRDCVRELAELAEEEYKTNGNGNGHH